MLILTRRVGETIVINGEEIKVMVLGVKGNQVRLGVSAPKDVSVHREEIYERIEKEKNKLKEQTTKTAKTTKATKKAVNDGLKDSE